MQPTGNLLVPVVSGDRTEYGTGTRVSIIQCYVFSTYVNIRGRFGESGKYTPGYVPDGPCVKDDIYGRLHIPRRSPGRRVFV